MEINLDGLRYERNRTSFSEAELALIADKTVGIVGCGGLGGQVISSLARFGVGRLVIIDGDVFNESNLNRQVFATGKTLGKSKALATKKMLQDINPEVEVVAYNKMLTAENKLELLAGCDLVVDCLDSIPARFLVAEAATELKIPMVYGAIAGFVGQLAVIHPGDGLLELIYPKREALGIEKSLGNPAFIPQLVGALQVSEALKIMAGREEIMAMTMLYLDLSDNSFEQIDFA